MAGITFFSEDIDFLLSDQQKITDWVVLSIDKEGCRLGEISYIFCSDNYLHDINLTYLNHDTYTDIITFDYTEGTTVSGDIFISIDRVKENAKKYDNLFNNELNRVLIHGVLHLLGYKDKSTEETEEMRAKEDFYLSLLSV